MRIAVYGGTFNPPHKGHIQAARAAGLALSPDRLFLIPTGIPPHKILPEDTPGPELRLKMASITAERIKTAQALDIEIRRAGPSFTADTIAEIKKEYPGAEIFLLMGTDMLLSIEKWYNFGYILSNAALGVFSRDLSGDERIKAASRCISEKYSARIELIQNDAVEISSSELREALTQRGGREYLDDEVYAYIVKNRLYGVKPDFDWLRERAYALLKPKRIAHVAGCEAEAVRLARRWGANEDEARCAAILHDITKKMDIDEQLILCEKYGIIISSVEKGENKLFHAKTGAAMALAEFGVSEDVHHAILWHTTGRANMSLLEKIIYLADYIEPTRQFAGLERLRELSYEDLDGAMLFGLEMSISDMKERGVCPHGRTAEAIEWLKGQRQ